MAQNQIGLVFSFDLVENKNKKKIIFLKVEVFFRPATFKTFPASLNACNNSKGIKESSFSINAWINLQSDSLP